MTYISEETLNKMHNYDLKVFANLLKDENDAAYIVIARQQDVINTLRRYGGELGRLSEARVEFVDRVSETEEFVKKMEAKHEND